MKYLLSEKEYKKLVNLPDELLERKQDIINELCVELTVLKGIRCPHSDLDGPMKYCSGCTVKSNCTLSKSFSK